MHEDFYFNEINGNQSLSHESLGIEMWRKDRKDINKYAVFSVYSVPTNYVQDLLTFIDHFTELLDQFQNKKAYFSCDTNINLLEIDIRFSNFIG